VPLEQLPQVFKFRSTNKKQSSLLAERQQGTFILLHHRDDYSKKFLIFAPKKYSSLN
jgi:hypothetical protein